MSDIVSFTWPFLVVLVILFIGIRIWMALVDTAAAGAKKMLGMKPKEVAWHTLEENKEALSQEGNEESDLPIKQKTL